MDTVDQILDVAGTVLEDYGDEFGGSRIERMARWIIWSAGQQINVNTRAGAITLMRHQNIEVMRVMQMIGVMANASISADQARVLSGMLLRAAEQADED